MKTPSLLPEDISLCVETLVDKIARQHLREHHAVEVVIGVEDVWANGIPAGDYEVIIRPRTSALGRKLATLNNPWMRMFER